MPYLRIELHLPPPSLELPTGGGREEREVWVGKERPRRGGRAAMERRGMDGWPWPSPLPPPSVGGGGGHLPPSLLPYTNTNEKKRPLFLPPRRRRRRGAGKEGGCGYKGQPLPSLSLPQPQTPFSFPLFLLFLFSPPIATLPKHCLLSYASLPLLFPRRRRLRTQLPSSSSSSSSSSCFPPSSPSAYAPVFSYCV